MQACIEFCLMESGFIVEEMWSHLNLVYGKVHAVVLSYRESGHDLRFGLTLLGSFEIGSK